MKTGKIITLTEIFIKRDIGWMFLNPSTKSKDGEAETFVNVNKISSFSRVNPKNEKITLWNSIFYDVSEFKNIDLEPYTYLEIIGSRNILVKETPEEIKKLMKEN